MNLPTTLQAVAERYSIPLTISRQGERCRLFNIVTQEENGKTFINAVYVRPGTVHPVEFDIKFGGDDT